MGAGVKVLVVGGAVWVASHVKRSGFAQCQIQLVPVVITVNPLQNTAELISYMYGVSGKTYLRNRTGGNKPKRALGGGNEKSEKQQNECKVQRERKRCRYLLNCKAIPLTIQSPCWTRYQISLKKTGTLEPMLEQRESVRGKALQRGTSVC